MSAKLTAMDRRQHPRSSVRELVVAVTSDAYNQICKIIDISPGGLAVRYDGSNNLPEGSYELTILADNDFHLTRMPVNTVCDFAVVNSIPFNTAERQRGLAFGDLNPRQQAMLESFIDTHSS